MTSKHPRRRPRIGDRTPAARLHSPPPCEGTMMATTRRALVLVLGLASLLLTRREDGAALAAAGPAPSAALLPPGVKAFWDLDKAHKDTTPTRERVCLNGLWRWQPAREVMDAVPADRWGYFKVPGFWPG